MQLEQVLMLLEPVLETDIHDKESFEAFENMIRSSLDCFLIYTDDIITDDVKSLKPPSYVKVYDIDCNFIKAHNGQRDKLNTIHPKLNKIWLSSMDTRIDFLKTLEDIVFLKLNGYLEISSRFLDVLGYLYFKGGELINARFGELHGEGALTFLIQKISQRIVNLNFYTLPEYMVDIYASKYRLERLEEDDAVHNIGFITKSKYALAQGMLSNGYFHIYIEDGKNIFSVLNDKLVDKLNVYEPFYLGIFSLEFERLQIDLKEVLKNYKPANALVKPTSFDKNFIFFCPLCWNPISETDIVCPYCGYNIENFTKLPYDTKLIIALNHPIADYRITVLNVIKSKKIKMALPFIKSIILKDDNPLVVQSAIDALITINKKEGCEFLERVNKTHEYGVVRQYSLDVYRRYCK